MEIVLNKTSKDSSSPRKFSVNRQIKFPQKSIHLSQISNLATNQVISVTATVIKIQEPSTKDSSRSTLLKQHTTIADSKGTNRLVLWENDVSSVQIGKTLFHPNLTIKEYNSYKFLSMGKSGALEPVDDIGKSLTMKKMTCKQD